jgi:hypothetical protein
VYSSAVRTRTSVAEKKKKAAPEKQHESKARAEAVQQILLRVEKQMSEGAVKASIGDYVKLLQLSKDMSTEPKTEIRVTWIEEPEQPSPTGE